MAKKYLSLIKNRDVSNCPFMFNNLLMRSPLRYSMMERRFLYKLSEAIKMRYESMNLKERDSWKDLVFKMTKKDLAAIGGNKNVLRTYETVRSLSRKEIIQFSINEKEELIVDFFHWIDAFRWNKDKNDYTVRVSPELYDYVVCLTKKFTVLNLHSAILLQSKYTQKFYELCCLYSGDFQFKDSALPNEVYKKRVLKISIDAFRYSFGLSDLYDPMTNKLIEKAKYTRYKTMETKVIKTAQEELYNLYQMNLCDVWFDYDMADRFGRGRGGSPRALLFYIYNRKNPKSPDPDRDRPWKEGDEPLFPYEEKSIKTKKAVRVVQASFWTQLDAETQRNFVLSILQKYFDSDQNTVSYYMQKIDEEQKQNKETYAQVMQVIHEKQNQPKFQQGSKKYQQKCLIDFVFPKNLKVYGWHIDPINIKPNNYAK